jgi:enoyl-CoA hydratase
MADYTTIRYEPVEDHIVRVVLDRAEKRNAQNHTMTNELDDAFTRAAADDDVKVILLTAEGPHFSAGHDQRTRGVPADIKTTGMWFGYELPGIEGRMAWTKEAYLDTVWRWRNIPKPIIGAAHGRTIGGGLALLWICDVIVASEDATFADPTPHVGVNGFEYFGHPWEFSPRKAKELLFTSDYLSAEDAFRLGMVNHVVPADQLQETALAIARKTAQKPSLGLKLAKEAVNAAADHQGLYTALNHAFAINVVGKAQMIIQGMPADGLGPGFLNVQTGDVNPRD